MEHIVLCMPSMQPLVLRAFLAKRRSLPGLLELAINENGVANCFTTA